MANERFTNALNHRPQKTPPIWLMRQAGRYHRHYQNLKERYTFVELCKQPELAAQVALGPVMDFDFDAAILFSDILFPLEALGMGLSYAPGPQLEWTLTPETLVRLKAGDEAIGGMEFQREAMRATRALLPNSKSLIGFVGGPWTLFTYAVEGSHKGGLKEAKRWSSLFPSFCELMVPFLVKNIELQLEGGAEIVMIFDTAAGELAPGIFQDLVVGPIQQLAQAFPQRIGYYTQGTQAVHLTALRTPRSPLAGIGVDHRWDLAQVLRESQQGFVQGNFDQNLLFTSAEDFERKLKAYLAPLRELTQEQRAGWICGFGHGVLPATPEAHVRRFVDLVRESFA